MRPIALLLLAVVLSGACAFAPTTTTTTTTKTSTSLDAVTRKEALAGLAALVGLPSMASAFSQQLDDNAYEPSQQATDGRLDLNSAFIDEYKQLRGMYPTAAGKIAANGPYASVKDIYKLPNLTDNDITLFKKYEKHFTVHPPGRAFPERINARVST